MSKTVREVAGTRAGNDGKKRAVFVAVSPDYETASAVKSALLDMSDDVSVAPEDREHCSDLFVQWQANTSDRFSFADRKAHPGMHTCHTVNGHTPAYRRLVGEAVRRAGFEWRAL